MLGGRISEAHVFGEPQFGVASVLLFGGGVEDQIYVASPFVEGGGGGKAYNNHTKYGQQGRNINFPLHVEQK